MSSSQNGEQQPCSSNSANFQNQNDQSNCETIQHQDDLVDNSEIITPASRRNAITPEAHHVDPIRQTEIQEKMSNLTMSFGGCSSGSSSHQADDNNNSNDPAN